MFRISALNDGSSDAEASRRHHVASATKEAKEVRAFALYNKALGHQRHGDVHLAEETFQELLCHGFVQEATKLVDDELDINSHPGLQLLYSIKKNLAAISAQREDYNSAMDAYLEAVVIDHSEVVVWHKIGTIALKLHNYSLAKFAFEQGLQCNPQHWPCLDEVISVLYAINDYWACLYYASKALEKDHHYIKGIAFRDQIFIEQPSLKRDTQEFFEHCGKSELSVSLTDCADWVLHLVEDTRKYRSRLSIIAEDSDPEIFVTELSSEESSEFIDEAIEMRRIRQKMSKALDPKPITLCKAIDKYTWKCVGESFIALYDKLTTSDPVISLGMRITLSTPTEEQVPSVPIIPPEPMEVEQVTLDEALPSVVLTDTSQPVSAVPSATSAESSAATSPIKSVGSLSSTTLESSSTSVSVTPMDPQQLIPVIIEDVISLQQSSATLPFCTSTVALQDHPIPLDPTASRRSLKRKRGVFMDDTMKRRSARVRNTSRKQEETICINYLLQKFLPSSLLLVNKGRDSFISSDNSDKTAEQDGKATDDEKPPPVPLTDTEEEDVRQYLEKSQTNCGLIDLMLTYLINVAGQETRLWPVGLADIYVNVYSRVRKHFDLPNVFCRELPDDDIRKISRMALVWSELTMDQWLTRSSRGPTSAGTQIRSPLPPVKIGFLGTYFNKDLIYLAWIAPCSDIFGDFYMEFSVRVQWLKARYFMVLCNMEEALENFEIATELLSSEPQEHIPSYKLVNCKHDNFISTDAIKKQQESLQRCQSLEEIQKWYDAKEYQKVIEFLLPTFTHPTQKNQDFIETGGAVPERHAQLTLLQDSLFKMKDYQKCVLWCEFSLNDALQHYKKAMTSAGKEDWSATLIQFFTTLDRCLSHDDTILRSLPATNLVRLTQNLILIIEITVDVVESATDMPIGSVLPWILLYRLINHEEKRLREMSLESGAGDIDAINSSLMLLNVAHEYLGRNSWCTKSDGTLLLFFMGVLKAEMMKFSPDQENSYKEDIEQAYEQCVFCLYNHPNKKGKARHLQDHNASQISLTWQRSVDIFDCFKPKTVPEFDSYKTSTVSGELEHLLRRISQMVPERKDAGISMESVIAYIEGNTNDPPSLTPEQETDMPVVREVFYLLADYYFKNKEQTKAIKFYLLDICVNPDRLDSWAGMALARMSRLEQKLNMMELKMDAPIHKQSIAALRCFRRAVVLDDTNSKLWIEYGCLAYELHSHACRQLKLKHWFALSDELLQIVNDTKQEMLAITHNCYNKASDCDTDEGEEWLQQYMMGKVAEKMKKSPDVYLQHYVQAANHLYEDYAMYPKKINYVVSPPRLAVESLEMYYRLHCSVIKLLLKKDEDVDCVLLDKYITEAAQSPFALGKEKKYAYLEPGTDSIDESSSFNMPERFTESTGHKKHAQSMDHNYSRQKSSSENSGKDDNDTDSSQSQPSPKRPMVPLSQSQSPDSQLTSISETMLRDVSVPEPVSHTFMEICEGDTDSVNTQGDSELKQKKVATFTMASLMDDMITAQLAQDSPKELSLILPLTESRKIATSSIENLASQSELDAIMASEKSIVQASNSELRESEEISLQDKLSEVSYSDKTSMIEKSSDVLNLAEKPCEDLLKRQDIVDYLPMEMEPDALTCDDSSLAIISSEEDSVLSDSLKLPINSVIEELLLLSNAANYKQPSVSSSEEHLPFATESVLDLSEHGSFVAAEDLEISLPVKGNQSSIMSIQDQSSSFSNEVEALLSEESKFLQKTEKSVVEVADDVSSQDGGFQQTFIDAIAGLTELSQAQNKLEVKVEALSAIEHQRSIGFDTSHLADDEDEGDVLKNDANVKGTKVESTDIMLGAPVVAECTDIMLGAPVVAERTDIMLGAPVVAERTDIMLGAPVVAESTDIMLGAPVVDERTDIMLEAPVVDERTELSQKVQLQEIKMSSVSENRDWEKSNLDNDITNQSLSKPKIKSTNVDNSGMKLDDDDVENITIRKSEDKDEIIVHRNETEAIKPYDNLDIMNISSTHAGTKDVIVAPDTSKTDSKDVPTDSSDARVASDNAKSIRDRKELIDRCITALHLCLSRFPTHYKSLYCLAYIYVHSPYQKNLQWARDLLVGRLNWQTLGYMPAQGLFNDRKHTNFFQGVWRIPIEEIDRAGSFATHMTRSVRLLLDILREQQDTAMLLHVHVHLMRLPDPGKKYMRDSERVCFARVAFQYSVDSIEANMPKMRSETNREKIIRFLLDAYKVWNHGQTRYGGKFERANKLFLEAYKLTQDGQAHQGPVSVDQAVRFCQHQQILRKPQNTQSSPSRGADTEGSKLSGMIKGSSEAKPVMSKSATGSLNVLSPLNRSAQPLWPITSPVSAMKSAPKVPSVKQSQGSTLSALSRHPMKTISVATRKVPAPDDAMRIPTPPPSNDGPGPGDNLTSMLVDFLLSQEELNIECDIDMMDVDATAEVKSSQKKPSQLKSPEQIDKALVREKSPQRKVLQPDKSSSSKIITTDSKSTLKSSILSSLMKQSEDLDYDDVISISSSPDTSLSESVSPVKQANSESKKKYDASWPTQEKTTTASSTSIVEVQASSSSSGTTISPRLTLPTFTKTFEETSIPKPRPRKPVDQDFVPNISAHSIVPSTSESEKGTQPTVTRDSGTSLLEKITPPQKEEHSENMTSMLVDFLLSQEEMDL